MKRKLIVLLCILISFVSSVVKIKAESPTVTFYKDFESTTPITSLDVFVGERFNFAFLKEGDAVRSGGDWATSSSNELKFDGGWLASSAGTFSLTVEGCEGSLTIIATNAPTPKVTFYEDFESSTPITSLDVFVGVPFSFSYMVEGRDFRDGGENATAPSGIEKDGGQWIAESVGTYNFTVDGCDGSLTVNATLPSVTFYESFESSTPITSLNAYVNEDFFFAFYKDGSNGKDSGEWAIPSSDDVVHSGGNWRALYPGEYEFTVEGFVGSLKVNAIERPIPSIKFFDLDGNEVTKLEVNTGEPFNFTYLIEGETEKENGLSAFPSSGDILEENEMWITYCSGVYNFYLDGCDGSLEVYVTEAGLPSVTFFDSSDNVITSLDIVAGKEFTFFYSIENTEDKKSGSLATPLSEWIIRSGGNWKATYDGTFYFSVEGCNGFLTINVSLPKVTFYDSDGQKTERIDVIVGKPFNFSYSIEGQIGKIGGLSATPSDLDIEKDGDMWKANYAGIYSFYVEGCEGELKTIALEEPLPDTPNTFYSDRTRELIENNRTNAYCYVPFQFYYVNGDGVWNGCEWAVPSDTTNIYWKDQWGWIIKKPGEYTFTIDGDVLCVTVTETTCTFVDADTREPIPNSHLDVFANVPYAFIYMLGGEWDEQQGKWIGGTRVAGEWAIPSSDKVGWVDGYGCMASEAGEYYFSVEGFDTKLTISASDLTLETGNGENMVPEYDSLEKQNVASSLRMAEINLSEEASGVLTNYDILNKELMDSAIEETGYAKGSDSMKLTVNHYLDMSVDSANIVEEGSTENNFVVDILPKFSIVAQLNDDDSTDVVINDISGLKVERSVMVKIYLPEGFATADNRVLVKHYLEDGSIAYYGGEDGLEIKQDDNGMYVEFENPDSFSMFEFDLTDGEVNNEPEPGTNPTRYEVPNTADRKFIRKEIRH